MFLRLGNQETRVQATDEELAWITDYLQFEDGSQSFYMADGKAGYAGTTRRRFYNYKTKVFPSGLAALVYRDAQKAGFQVRVIDERRKPADLDPDVDLEWLKERKLQDGTPFQYSAVLRSMTRTRGLLWIPTGGGKTEIAVGMMKAVHELRWLFLAPEADLMYNAARRYELRTGEPAGLIGDGKYDVEDKRIVCATFQTLAARLKNPAQREDTIKLLHSFEGLVIDEVHQLPADDFYAVALSVPNAYYRIGMSGTALARGDKRSMYILAALGEVIHRITPTTLMDAGWISRPTVRFIPVTQPGPTQTQYINAYKAAIVRSDVRNKVVVTLAEKAKKPCLVFVKFEAHGREILKRLRANGKVTAEFMCGKHSIRQRDQMLDRVKHGDTEVIIATKVLQTGTDVPELLSGVIATGGASNIETIQRVGRMMRVMHDKAGRVIKDTADIWEIYDKDAKKRSPTTKRMRATRMKWFEDHSKERFRSYCGEGYPTIMLTPAEAVKYGSTG